MYLAWQRRAGRRPLADRQSGTAPARPAERRWAVRPGGEGGRVGVETADQRRSAPLVADNVDGCGCARMLARWCLVGVSGQGRAVVPSRFQALIIVSTQISSAQVCRQDSDHGLVVRGRSHDKAAPARQTAASSARLSRTHVAGRV
jgi:hypothetical protein